MLKIVIKFLLSRGISYLEDLSKSKQEEMEAAVKAAIPGEMFDELVWGAVKGLIPMAFAAAKKYLEGMSLAAIEEASEAQVAAVESAVKDMV